MNGCWPNEHPIGMWSFSLQASVSLWQWPGLQLLSVSLLSERSPGSAVPQQVQAQGQGHPGCFPHHSTHTLLSELWTPLGHSAQASTAVEHSTWSPCACSLYAEAVISQRAAGSGLFYFYRAHSAQKRAWLVTTVREHLFHGIESHHSI